MGYALDWEAPLGVVKRFFGPVTGQDILDSVIETEASVDFDRLRWVINDFLAATSVTVTVDELDEIAAIDRAAAQSNPYIRIAVVATQPSIIEAARHYAESPMNRYPTRIFPTLPEAHAWLAHEA